MLSSRPSWLCADVISTAQQAAALAHADLATSVVMEMTALAGTMGRHYAQQEGLPAPVCEAIYEAVLPRNAGDAVPTTPAGTFSCAPKLQQLTSLPRDCQAFVDALNGWGSTYALLKADLAVVSGAGRWTLQRALGFSCSALLLCS